MAAVKRGTRARKGAAPAACGACGAAKDSLQCYQAHADDPAWWARELRDSATLFHQFNEPVQARGMVAVARLLEELAHRRRRGREIAAALLPGPARDEGSRG